MGIKAYSWYGKKPYVNLSMNLLFLMQAYSLSRDHKPDLEAEKEGILKAGGVKHAGRVNGSLNLARAIGTYLTLLWTPDPSPLFLSVACIVKLWLSASGFPREKWLDANEHKTKAFLFSILKSNEYALHLQKHVCIHPSICALPLTPPFLYSCLCLYLLMHTYCLVCLHS